MDIQAGLFKKDSPTAQATFSLELFVPLCVKRKRTQTPFLGCDNFSVTYLRQKDLFRKRNIFK